MSVLQGPTLIMLGIVALGAPVAFVVLIMIGLRSIGRTPPPRPLRRIRPRVCAECGYDKRGLPAGRVCPECGARAPGPMGERRRGHRPAHRERVA